MKQNVLAKSLIGAAASLVLGFAFVNCSSNSPDSIGGGTGNGNNSGAGNISGGGGTGLTTSLHLPDASASAGGNGGDPTPTADANCGVKTSNATKSPVDVLLVLDRSGSMSESIAEDCCCDNTCNRSTGKSLCTDTTNCTQRWPAVTAAVTATISKTAEINWALKMFSTASGMSGGSSCTVGNAMEVQFGRPAGDISTAIASTSPGGATPTAKALTTGTDYLKGVKDQNNKVILLATDGDPNCKGGSANNLDLDGTTAAAQAALTAGFKVYVIGIGSKLDNLSAIATAGGTGDYYKVGSPDELAAALQEISKAVASCTFTMDQSPPEPNNIAVYVGATAIDKDPANGWSYGGNSQTVNFNGSACDLLKSGSAGQVKVMFGCGGSPPPPLF